MLIFANWDRAECFQRKVDRLEKIHSNTLELLPEKDYDAEFGVVEEFRDKASCMPEDLLKAFQRGLNFDSGDDSKKRLDDLLKFLKTEVESKERINLSMAGFDLTDATSYKRERALNPAALPSRGCCAHQLLCSRWWKGPKWLLHTEENWSVTKPIFDEPSILKEKRKTNPTSKNLPFVCSLNQFENSGKNNNEDSGLYYYYFSSCDRLVRMMV
ncbi:uncharacterized protein TNCV_2463091 [Trichonephila clavipes]|nr:uncharacterized protein TNCV_2463091 [Trichonephila clavipes]